VDADSGRVTAVDPEGELPTRFLNSTIEQLVRSIDAYRDYGSSVSGAADESAARALVKDLRQALARIDPAAVAGPETWWALVLEQATAGLL
jgi:hypothetical protein